MVILEAKPATPADIEVSIGPGDAQNLTSFVDWLKHHLQFPPYCSPNLNSLEECINDLSWLPEEAQRVRLRIENYDGFLSHEQDQVRANILDIFERTNLPADGDEPARTLEVSIVPTKRAEADLARSRVRE
jgi:Barstar (barnase inhibitor)